jgi:membrane-associated protein
MDLKELLHGDLAGLIQTVGLLGVWTIVFVESGLLIGFFLPGDSLLFTAGFLSAQGVMDITLLTVGSFIAAVVGDSVGYWIGHRYGRKLFQKEDSLLFQKSHLKAAEAFYEKHGGKTIILARFMPFVRTFAPVVAGIGQMKYSTFLFYNIIGGLLWAVGLTLAGYFFGNIPIVKENFEKVIFLIIFASVAPAVFHILKDEGARNGILKLLKLKK